jgi:hypothetical protein
MPTREDLDSVRGSIEQTHNKIRDDRERQFIDDRVALLEDYHADLKSIREAKEAALLDAGLNADGSTPPDFYAVGGDEETP